MNANKLFTEFSIKKIWDKLLSHDKAMNSTLLILSSGNWIEQTDGTFTNTVSHKGFTENDKLTVDLYDDGTLTELQLNEYEQYIDKFEIASGTLVVTANTKPTQTLTIIVKGDFESTVNNIGNIEELLQNQSIKMEQLESNFTMAAEAIGNALVAKDIEVPEGTSLLEMADIINNMDSLDPKVTIYYMVDTNKSYSESYYKGDNITNPTSFIPTKSGYEFVGWRVTTEPNSDVLEAKPAEKAITLYALFKKNVVLSFNGNNHTSGSITSMNGDSYYNNGYVSEAVFTLPSGSAFTKAGYQFNGWALGSASGTKYSAGSTIKITENKTMYATWTATTDTIWSGVIEKRGTSSTETPIVCGTFDLTNHKSLELTLTVENPNIEATVYVYLNGNRIIKWPGLQFTNPVTASKTVDISSYTGNQEITIDFSGHDGRTEIEGSIKISP